MAANVPVLPVTTVHEGPALALALRSSECAPTVYVIDPSVEVNDAHAGIDPVAPIRSSPLVAVP